MAYSLIANTTFAGGVNGGTSSAINTTGADLLVLQLAYYDGVAQPTVSDSKSNSWTALTPQDSGTGALSLLYYAKNPTVGTNHTFTVSATNLFASFEIQAWSGANTVAPFDVQNGAHSVSGTSLQTGSVTPGANGELLVSGLAQSGATASFAINSGFTKSNTVVGSGGNWFGSCMAYLVQGTAGAINPTWSWSGASDTGVGIAAFKAAATRAVKMAGRWGGYVGSSGGFAG